ncbi:MAG: glycosyltransferase [Phycisphaerales bacterium]|nr:glycosyltransferase [Phycisphaerales bacterium]
MISYVLPTRNRPHRLKHTLLEIARLGDHASCGGAEVIVVDNASDETPILGDSLEGGIGLRLIRRPTNEGAAARNHGASAARGDWIVMLDDDSYPTDLAFLDTLRRQGDDVGAVSADIRLARGEGQRAARESGGLPEVFIGCGVALRRSAIERVGMYDPAFGYYVEEYDLAARLLLAGCRVAFEPRFRVTHAKDAGNRDMNLILERLVRNNAWVMQRYAPDNELGERLRETRRRYHAIARKEDALAGYARGRLDLWKTLHSQPRRPMPGPIWERFTGLAAARAALQSEFARSPFRSAMLVDAGKNAYVVAQALTELGVRIVSYGEDADALVVATMSPGPMLDAYEARRRARRGRGPRVIAPWTLAEEIPALAAA